MYTLGNSCHFRMVMPIKFLPWRDNNKEESKFFLSFNGKSNYIGWYFDLSHDLIQLRHIYFVDLACQELEMI